jgi:hypothetical protein
MKTIIILFKSIVIFNGNRIYVNTIYLKIVGSLREIRNK